MLSLTLASSAFASKWAGVEPTSYGAGVRSDIYTPSSSLSGIPSGTTVKAAVWIRDQETDDWAPNAGWLIRPGTYNDPKSYYVYTDTAGGEYPEYLSTQSYGVSRAYEIYYDPVSHPGKRWSIKVVGTWRHHMYMYTASYNRSMGGGKTSANNANLWSHLTTVQYKTTGGSYTNFPSSSTTYNDSPLLIDINYSKYDFDVYNDNYW